MEYFDTHMHLDDEKFDEKEFYAKTKGRRKELLENHYIDEDDEWHLI